MEVKAKMKVLEDILEEDFSQYMKLLRRRFTLSSSRLTREEFDQEIMDFIPVVAIDAHHDFLYVLMQETNETETDQTASVKECQSISSHANVKQEEKPAIKKEISFFATDTPLSPLSRTKLPPRRILKNPVDLGDYLPIVKLPEEQDESPIMLDFPDPKDIHGRALTIVLEQNLNKVQQPCVNLIMNATRILLKNVISAVLTRRSRYEKRFPYTTGLTVTNTFPHKRPKLNPASDSQMSNSCQSGSSSVTIKYDENASNISRPVSARDLYTTLKIHREIIPNGSIYFINMERISCYMDEPSEEELMMKAQMQFNLRKFRKVKAEQDKLDKYRELQLSMVPKKNSVKKESFTYTY